MKGLHIFDTEGFNKFLYGNLLGSSAKGKMLSFENIDIEDTIASRLIDVESEIAKQELLELMSRAVPNVDMEIVVQYVEKFAGIKGGGPTYMMIFLIFIRHKPFEKHSHWHI